MMNYRDEADRFLAQIFWPGDQRIAPLTEELVRLLERAHQNGAEEATQLIEQSEEEQETAEEVEAQRQAERAPQAADEEPEKPYAAPKPAPPKKNAPPKRVLSAKPRPKKKR